MTFNATEMENNVLDAKDVYILMKKEYRISRNVRAEWYLERINSRISISRKTNINEFNGSLDVVSVLPEDPPQEWDSDTAHEYEYLITEKTQLHFIARKYRIVFCLDLSPSFSTVNAQKGQIIFDQIFATLETCLKGIVRPFIVPGSQLLFYPKIYLTIIAHTPFIRAQTHQVLIQGWLLMNEEKNLGNFLKNIHSKLFKLQQHLAELTKETNDQICLSGSQFKIPPVKKSLPSSTEMSKYMVNPDIGFVDLLRYGIVSLQLLPENSMAGIIVITDGVISLPDATIFDSLLVQLRNLTISCSFLQLGSPYDPSIGLGYIPFNDLMQFLAKATFGVHLPELPAISIDYQNEMNEYHKAFLTWEFQKAWHISPDDLSKSSCQLMVFEPELPLMVRKREWASPLMVTLPALLSCRLREGYSIKQVSIVNEQIMLILVLPWKYSISIEYHISCPWPLSTSSSLQTQVWIEASYEFLEDVSQNNSSILHHSHSHQGFRSLYREKMVAKYWSTLQDLRETDLRLAALQSFASCPANFALPDCFKMGHPVFFLSPQNNLPTPSNEGQFAAFCNFWKPVSMLNIAKWQKWMHIHRIGVILQHDPSILNNLSLHTTSTSGRYVLVDTRRSEVLLMTLLADWSDFTLIESYSYVKFLYDTTSEDGPPSSFFVIRISSKKPPCLTIHLAFLGGTSGSVRNKIVEELRERITRLRLRLREPSKESNAPISQGSESKKREDSSDATKGVSLVHTELKRTSSESSIPCCSFSCKPIEKILICYERIPLDIHLSHVQECYMAKSSRKSLYTKLGRNNGSKLASNNQTLLSRYLHHQRWIWGLQPPSAPAISSNAITRILNTLIRMRLQEGFKFAYSYNGNITMVKEIKMKLEIEDSNLRALRKHFDLSDKTSNCIVQYVMFPTHYIIAKDRAAADGDDTDSVEADGEPHLITEVWVEPQNGVNMDFHQPLSDKPIPMNYKEVAQSFYDIDNDCIRCLATFESLVQECEQNHHITEDPQIYPSFTTPAHGIYYEESYSSQSQSKSAPIREVPYHSNFIILLNHCLQAETHFSTLVKDFSGTLLMQSMNKPNIASLQDKSQANQSFYSLFLKHLHHLHNGHQFQLSSRDCAGLPHHFTSRSLLQPEQPHSSLYSHISSFPKEVAKWRCFVKLISSNHALFTLLPSTYYDLQLLFANQISIQDINSKSFTPFLSRDDIDKIMEEIVSIRNKGFTLTSADPLKPSRRYSTDRCSIHDSASSNGLQEISHTILRTDALDILPPLLRHTSISGSADVSRQFPPHQDKRTRYRSGPALVLESRVGNGSNDQIQQTNGGDSFRERANSLQNASDRAHCGLEQTSSSVSQPKPGNTAHSIEGPKERRKRNASMPSRSHREVNASLRSSSAIPPDSDFQFQTAQLCSSLAPLHGSLTLPVYTYECKLPAVINQLINGCERESIVGCDFFMDSLFKNDAIKTTFSPPKDDAMSESYTSHEASIKSPPPESAGNETKLLQNLVDSVERSHRRSFVMGVFEALSKNLYVQPFDVQCALDQCQEIFLEIDITEYMKVICGHLKEFHHRVTYEEQKQRQLGLLCSRQRKESVNKGKLSKDEEQVKPLQGKIDGISDADTEDEHSASKSTIPPSTGVTYSFPLSFLTSHKAQQDLAYIHDSIRQHFKQIVETHFRPVPGLDDYYYYHRPHFRSSESQNSCFKSALSKMRSKKKSFKSSLSEDVEDVTFEPNDTDAGLACLDESKNSGVHNLTQEIEDDERDKSIEFRSEIGSLECNRFIRQVSQVSQFSGFEDWTTLPASDEDDRDNPSDFSNISPLFLHLTCTIRSGGQVLATTSINSLPTCLSDIASSIDGTNLPMDQFSITLELLVMTLIGGAPIHFNSFSTSSSGGTRIRVFSTSDGKLFCRSLSQCSAVQRQSFSELEDKVIEDEALSEFPEEQSRAVASTFEKIKWLMEDEIISSKLQSLSITEQMLSSVTNHIKKSVGFSPNCLLETVPLKFVFGLEQSMAEFLQGFEELKIPHYRLEKKGSLYFLLIDSDDQIERDCEAKKSTFLLRRKTFNSIVPISEIGTINVHKCEKAGHNYMDDAQSTSIKESLCLLDLSKSPKRLQQKVSFEGDVLEEKITCDDLVTKDSEKEKVQISRDKQMIKRRLKRRERRDSDRRISGRQSLSCHSSSESDLEVRLPPIPLTHSQNEIEETIVSEPEKINDSSCERLDEEESVPVSATKGKDEIQSENVEAKNSPMPEEQRSCTIKESASNLLSDNLQLIRCDSVNIPHVALDKKTELIRKSASTDGFGYSALHHIGSDTPLCSKIENLNDGPKSMKQQPSDLHNRIEWSCKSRHSSGGDILKSRHNSGTGSFFGALSDGSSLLESACHTTTEEDGCEGDVSDMDEANIVKNETDCLCQSSLLYASKGLIGDLSPPVCSNFLPPFWLIIKITQDKVQIYYHRRVDLNSDLKLESIHREVVDLIKELIKIVNQRMLLRDLNDRRECNQLLEPETSDDIWSKDTNKDVADDEDSNECLEAEMKFKLGAFSCNRVWSADLELHPRIASHVKGVSIGIHTVRKVLSHLSVNKRKNMFVYEDTALGSNNIFYLKISEDHPHSGSLGEGTWRDESGGAISRSSSIPSIGKRGSGGPKEEEPSTAELRPRGSSFGEKDVIVEGVATGGHQRRAPNCITVAVHGIAQPSSAIKEDLMNLLKNKLDEAVLDTICQMPWKSPHHKLTADDVHFIQPLYEPPTDIFRFSVNAFTLPFLEALCYYLRQNLLISGFIIPKYLGTRSDHHFQDYSTSVEPDSSNETPTSPSDSTDISSSCSSNTSSIFLFVNSHKKSGSNGVACVSFSLVDSAGNIIQPTISSPSSTEDLTDISAIDFASLIFTEHYESSKKGKPDALALLQFKVWQKGTLDMKKCLHDNICHALWDLITEMHFLTVPICLPFNEPSESPPNAGSNEEMLMPNSPLKSSEKQGGPSPPRGFLTKTFVPSATSSPVYKTFDYQGKTTDGGTGRLGSPFKVSRHASLDYGRESSTLRHEHSNAFSPNSETEENSSIGSKGLLIPRKLNPFYAKTLIQWLQFGLDNNVPTVRKYIFNSSNRDAIPVFVTELQKWADTNMHSSLLFQESKPKSVEEEGKPEFVELYSLKTLKDLNNDKLPNLMLISGAGNVRMTPLGCSTDSPTDFLDAKGTKAKFLYKSFKTGNISEASFDSGIPSSGSHPPPISPSTFAPIWSSQSAKFSPVPGSNDGSNLSYLSSNFGTNRQKLLLARFEDKEISVYFYPYNWAKDPCDLLNQTLIRLSQWTAARASLLSSLSLQKLGLFHNHPFIRTSKDGSSGDTSPFMGKVAHVKGLIRSQLPTRESLETSKKNEASKRSLCELYRDASPPKSLKMMCPVLGSKSDLLTQHGMQMAEISKQNFMQRNERNYLHLMVSPNNKASSINTHSLGLFKKNGHIAHFCFTPLLFLPRWRGQIAETRDHLFHQVEDLNTKVLDEGHRSRHTSGSNVRPSVGIPSTGISPHLEVRRLSSCGISPSSSGLKSSTIPPPRQHASASAGDEKWHETLCLSYLKEYIQYLQCIGYTRVSISRLSPGSRSGMKEKDAQLSKIQEEDISKPTYFMKTVPGGTILIELSFKEPFFVAMVYALEHLRLLSHRSKAYTAVPNGFLDAIEVLKVILHMHSFTYDYHLRSVCAYVANRQLLFTSGYHLSSFLSDFKKYYYKGPSFARNLIYAGDICIANTGTTGEQLYNYLLAREKHYDLKVLRMVPVIASSSSDVKTEFVLVHTKACYELPFFPEDSDIEFESDNYEVTLLVSHDTMPMQDAAIANPDDAHTLRLKIYVILTNTGNMYPNNSGLEQKGRFRTVSTALTVDHLRSGSITDGESSQGGGSSGPTSHTDGGTDGDASLSSVGSTSSGALRARIASAALHFRRKASINENDPILPPPHINIRQCQEFVNYLGYYSPYEVGLQQALQHQVQEARERIIGIFNRAKIHCRRDMLWQKMMACLREEEKSKSKDSQATSCLSFQEFTELLKLVSVIQVSALDDQLLSLVFKPIQWHQSLARLLTNKYQEYSKTLSSDDGNYHYILVFSPSCPEACILLTMDLNKQRGELCLVQKASTPNCSFSDEDEGIETFILDPRSRNLLEQVINCACFHLWSSLLS